MKKTLVVLFYLFILIPMAAALQPTPVIGNYIVGVVVLGPIAWFALLLLFVWLPNSNWTPRWYTQYDLDQARHEGIQQGRRG